MIPDLETVESPIITSLETGVDWITLTCRQEDERRQDFARSAWDAKDQQTSVTMEQLKPWKWHGYEGWRVSGLSYGRRQDTDIIVASGPTANRFWRLFHKTSTNVSRLDLQCTVLLNEPIPGLVQHWYNHISPVEGRKAAMVVNNCGGTTLYVGSRSSDQFGRFYDKGIESGVTLTPGLVYRYEVEYKAERAKKMSDTLYLQICSRRPAERVIPATVWTWFNDRSVAPIYPSQPGEVPIIVSLDARDENTERTLTWLKMQVRPSVARLLPHHRLRALQALGLDDLLRQVDD